MFVFYMKRVLVTKVIINLVNLAHTVRVQRVLTREEYNPIIYEIPRGENTGSIGDVYITLQMWNRSKYTFFMCSWERDCGIR